MSPQFRGAVDLDVHMQAVAHRQKMNAVLKQAAANMANAYDMYSTLDTPRTGREADREAFARDEITLEEYETREEARLKGSK